MDLGPVRVAAHRRGTGRPSIVFVHGSLDDHHTWDAIADELGDFATVAYDRRGHGASTDLPSQGSIVEDVDDVVALIGACALERPLVVGHSYGACIAIALAGRRPDLVGGLYLHEPPLFALLDDDDGRDVLRAAKREMATAAELAESGEIEAGTRHFVEHVAFGAGSWTDQFDACERSKLIAHIDTWLDQSRDPDRLAVDVGALVGRDLPIVLSCGASTLPAFAGVTDRIAVTLPSAKRVAIEGAGHGAPRTHPGAIAEAIRAHPALG